jgi:hypothetical protein
LNGCSRIACLQRVTCFRCCGSKMTGCVNSLVLLMSCATLSFALTPCCASARRKLNYAWKKTKLMISVYCDVIQHDFLPLDSLILRDFLIEPDFLFQHASKTCCGWMTLPCSCCCSILLLP